MTAGDQEAAEAQVTRATLPNWPRLMGEQLAAAYLSIGKTTLRGLDIPAQHVGRRVLYDRHDLDAFADQLSGRTGENAIGASKAMERAFFEKRRQRGKR